MLPLLLKKFCFSNTIKKPHKLLDTFKNLGNRQLHASSLGLSPFGLKSTPIECSKYLEKCIKTCTTKQNLNSGPCNNSPLKNLLGKSSKTRQVCFQSRCSFQTSSRREAWPAMVVLVISRFSKFGVMLLGRTARKFWRNLPSEEKVIWKQDLKRRRYVIAGIVGAIAMGVGLHYQTHIQETPITNRKRYIAFTNEQIADLSKMQFDELLQENEGCIIPATEKGLQFYQRAVKVSQQLINGNQDLHQIHDKEWTVTVVYDDRQMNAFVLPHGSIFIYSGMLLLCDTDDQLGIILGHEMAHAVLNHSAEEISLQHFFDCLYLIPLAALWALLPSDLTAYIAHWIATQMKELTIELPYCRFIEEEADKVGFILAAKACFDIREAPVVWAKINLVDGDDSSKAWLSTHPTHKKRQAQLQDMVQEGINIRGKCQCPLLPALDPRLKIPAYDKMFKIDFYHRKEKLLVPLSIKNECQKTISESSQG